MARTLPRSLTVRPVQVQGRLEETRYTKSDDGLRYRHESDADLWLVETKDGRRATLAMPRRGQGWTREGSTTWLTNAPRGGGPMKTKKSKKRRPPPGGWKKYMARIRPNRGKRTMAKTRRRKSTKAARAGRSRVVIVNPPKRRHYGRRRNNPPALSVAGVVGRVMNGAIGGATIVATEVATRMIRSRILGMPAGEMLSGAVELGISSAAGLAAEYMLGGATGARFGQLIVDAGFASVIRATVKQSKAPWVADALADDTRRQNFVVRGGRVERINGYVAGAARLNGYVPGQGRPALGGYVPGKGAAEQAAAAAMTMGRG